MALSLEQVQAILRAGLSPRAKRIEVHQKYVDGTVYDGRPDFLDDASDKPITQRKPCVQYPAARNAIRTLACFCLGDGRFPVITSATSEDDAAFDARLGLGEEDSKILDSGIVKVCDQTRLETVAKQLLEAAMGGKSVAAVASVLNGRLCVKYVDPKTCEPEFDEKDPTRVVKLTESYRYTTDEKNPDTGKWEPHVWQYKRVIDAKTDTVFKPVEVLKETDSPDPTAVKTKIEHGFGFCPVIWYRFRKQESTAGDIDGQALHEGMLPLIDAVNIGKSQRFRAALYCGDPQVVETGVEDPGSVRAPSATVATASMTRDTSGYGESLIPAKRAGGMTTRKKGAGVVWQYDSPDAKVELLCLPGDALKTLVEDVDDNIAILRESLGVIYVAPEDVTGSGDVSGKTLDVTYRPQISVANEIREEFWRLCLLPLLSMLLRIVVVVVKQKKGLYLGGADKIAKVAARFQQEVEGAGDSWFDPSLKAKWGDYFEPSDQDESTRITNAKSALGGGDGPSLITLDTAVAHIKPIFPDIQSVPQYVQKLKAEKAEKDAALHAALGALGGTDPNDPNAAPKPSQGDAPNGQDGAGGGSGSDPASGKGGAAPPAAAAPAAKAAASSPAKAAAPAPAAKPAAPAQAAKASDPAPARKPAKQRVTGKSSLTTPAGKLTTVGADGATHELFGPTDHMRATDESPGIAEKVYRDLTEDYDEKQLEWVKHASWRGPLVVPLEQIDWTKQQDWPASEDEDHIQDFVERIESDGYVKPIILVNEPNNDKLVIADGHHRALAYKKLGQNPMAYVASVGGVMQNGGDADWRVMHDSQRGGSDQIKK